MDHPLLRVITSTDPAIRDQPLEAWADQADRAGLLAACESLDGFRRRSENLYERVRALFFLYAIHRFHLPRHRLLRGESTAAAALIPYRGYEQLLQRRFEEAIDSFLAVQA